MARGRFLALVSFLALLTVLPAAPVAAVTAGRVAIGDSVMLGAADELRADGFRVNARVSRQMRDAAALVRGLKRAGKLPTKVVIHLGTNGLFQVSDCDAAVTAAGPHRHVYLVTIKVPRPHRAPDNRRLRTCARRHSNASIIDWFTRSRTHPAWFAPDGYHLTQRGQNAYAAFLDKAGRAPH